MIKTILKISIIFIIAIILMYILSFLGFKYYLGFAIISVLLLIYYQRKGLKYISKRNIKKLLPYYAVFPFLMLIDGGISHYFIQKGASELNSLAYYFYLNFGGLKGFLIYDIFCLLIIVFVSFLLLDKEGTKQSKKWILIMYCIYGIIFMYNGINVMLI